MPHGGKRRVGGQGHAEMSPEELAALVALGNITTEEAINARLRFGLDRAAGSIVETTRAFATDRSLPFIRQDIQAAVAMLDTAKKALESVILTLHLVESDQARAKGV